MKRVGVTSGLVASGSLAGCASNRDGGDGGGTNTGGTTSSGDGSGGSKSIKGPLHYNLINSENAYYQAILKGAKEVVDTLGFEGLGTSSSQGNVSDMVSQIDTAVGNAAGIWSRPIGGSGVPQMTKTCVQNNVPVTFSWATARWLTPPDQGEEWVQYNAPDSVLEGRMAAKVMAEALGGEGNYVEFAGYHGDLATDARGKGFRQVMSEYPDINNLMGDQPSLEAEYTRSGAQEAMSSYVSKFGDKIDACYAHSDSMLLGALPVIDEQDIPVKAMVGVDAIPEWLNKIQEREIATGTVSPNPVWQGGWNAVQLYDWLQGEKFQVPQRMAFTNDVVVVEDTSQFDLDLQFTFMNAANFQKQIYEDKSPYDWELMSRAESGEDWNAQNGVRTIKQSDFTERLLWNEDKKPNGYSVPDIYNNTEKFKEVDQWYSDHFQSDPLVN